MQKSFYFVLIHLIAYYTVTLRRHREEAIGHFFELRSAIIRPKLGHVIYKALDMVVRRYRKIYESSLIKAIIAERVYYLKFAKETLYQFARLPVASQNGDERLVRHVEIDFIFNPFCVYVPLEFGSERR